MNTQEVSEALGVTERSIQRTVRLVTDSAKIRGYAPEYDMTHAVPG
jgi:transcriptional antiterminator